MVVPGQPVTSVSILGLHKSDMRLLHLAAKLGPVITEAARQVFAAMAEQDAAGDDDAQEAPVSGLLSPAPHYRINAAFSKALSLSREDTRNAGAGSTQSSAGSSA